MTDMPNTATPRHSLLKPDARTVKRNRAEARFKSYGIAAIAVGLLMLAILLTTRRGLSADVPDAERATA
jgi:phosphate transport system permease protein